MYDAVVASRTTRCLEVSAGERFTDARHERTPPMVLAMFPHIARGGDGGPRVLVPLLFLVLIGGLVAWLIRRRRGATAPTGSGSAIETLRESFARGDIDRAEFEHRRAVLDGADVVPPAPARTATATATAPPPPRSAEAGSSASGPVQDAEVSDATDTDDGDE